MNFLKRRIVAILISITLVFASSGMLVFAGMQGMPEEMPLLDDDYELVGTWAWEEDAAWTYTFNSNGTGIRGNAVTHPTTEFEWSIEGYVLHIECFVAMFGVYSERWSFTIEDDVLILDSLQGGDVGLRYNRQ